MQQYEITYDAIIEDLARAGKILDPEDLAITYLNTLPDTYSSLIRSMEPVLATLTSQSIKAKVREEEQRLKNVANGNGGQTPSPINTAANTTIITLAVSGNVEGLEILENSKQDAHDMNMFIDCAMGKIYKSSFPFINNKHSEKRALIHSDTCESMQVSSFDRNR